MSKRDRLKRRSERSDPFRRKEPSLQPRARVLIVSEGSQTEPLYFEALRVDKRLMTAEVIVTGDCGTDPRSVVEKAKSKANATVEKDGDAFDQVWCVIDRDSHDAKNLAEAFDMGSANGFKFAFSNPCFELWFLLHFEDQRAYIERNKVKSKLCKHIKYDKAVCIYKDIQMSQGEAVKRAGQIRKQKLCGDEMKNPWTTVDRLVSALLSIASS